MDVARSSSRRIRSLSSYVVCFHRCRLVAPSFGSQSNGSQIHVGTACQFMPSKDNAHNCATGRHAKVSEEFLSINKTRTGSALTVFRRCGGSNRPHLVALANLTLEDEQMHSRIATTIVIVLVSLASADAAVPAPLSEALAEYGCVHITDDAEVLRDRGGWWVSLKPFTGGDADFAFYCQAAADKLVSKLVVVVRGENSPWRGCDPVVDSWRERSVPWFPYGLAVVNTAPRYSRHTDLSRWWLVSSSRNPKVTYGPAGLKVADPIIDTTGSTGAGTLYACHSRQWYRIGLD